MQRHETDRMRPFAVRTPLVHPADASGTYAPTMPTPMSSVMGSPTSSATRALARPTTTAGERMRVLS